MSTPPSKSCLHARTAYTMTIKSERRLSSEQGSWRRKKTRRLQQSCLCIKPSVLTRLGTESWCIGCITTTKRREGGDHCGGSISRSAKRRSNFSALLLRPFIGEQKQHEIGTRRLWMTYQSAFILDAIHALCAWGLGNTGRCLGPHRSLQQPLALRAKRQDKPRKGRFVSADDSKHTKRRRMLGTPLAGGVVDGTWLWNKYPSRRSSVKDGAMSLGRSQSEPRTLRAEPGRPALPGGLLGYPILLGRALPGDVSPRLQAISKRRKGRKCCCMWPTWPLEKDIALGSPVPTAT
mmetsp:Transcript_68176/g.142467  ORF Transcript_68176/g.142467 Transcript_68176/m.142467 type:complete len:292 (-) Transcript_68176:329-1204(-)